MNITTLLYAFGSMLLSPIFPFLSSTSIFPPPAYHICHGILRFHSFSTSSCTPPTTPPCPLSTFCHALSSSLLISSLSLSAFHLSLSPTSSSSISPSAPLHLPLTFQLDVSAPPGTRGEKMDEVHSGCFSSRLFISFSVCFKFHLN